MLNFRLFLTFVLVLFLSLSSVYGASPICSVQLESQVSKSAVVKRSTAWIKGSQNTRQAIANMLEIEREPRIITAAMEFGKIQLNGVEYNGKVGGLGVVIQDWINEMPRYLKNRGGGSVGFVFPSFDGMPKGEYVTRFKIQIGHDEEWIKLYKLKHEKGGDIFIVDHPIFKRHSIRNSERNLYVAEDGPALLDASHPEWDDAYFYSLYNQAIAKTVKHYNANIYHAHDYHTAMAGFFVDPKEVSVGLTIHNGGYPGRFYTKGYGTGRAPHPDYAYGVPTGDFQANDFFLNNIMKVSFDDYMKYFNYDGNFEILPGMARYLEAKFGSAGIGVSRNYGMSELRMNPEEVFNKIRKENGGRGPLVPEKVYIPNDGRYLGNVQGKENGMAGGYRSYLERGEDAAGVHASGHKMLRAKSDEEIAKMHKIIPEEVRQEWRYPLNYGQDLDSIEGIQQALDMKRKIKSMALRTYFPEKSAYDLEQMLDEPLIGLVARFVDQKNLKILADAIDDIVANGGRVIVGGQPGDEAGRAAARLFEKYSKKYPDNVVFVNDFVNNERALLIQAGGDISPFTPKFEPCGLTDIEAAWLGTFVLTRKTGGLDKLGDDVAMFYNWLDSSNPAGETEALKTALHDVFDMYRNNRKEFNRRIIKGMKSEFSYEENFKYLEDSWRSGALNQVVQAIEADVKNGALKGYDLEQLLSNFVKGVHKDNRAMLKQIIQAKDQKGAVELMLLERL